ncbi:CDP-diacylglycerol-inositol 3-phosphatidyltransferase [Serendipita sp. 399]|nr:CDP-diacylglycerol-inositol 3-phosphatidyltransferase [Serendipita sp. 399]
MSKRLAHAVVKGRRATLSDVDASQAHEIATYVFRHPDLGFRVNICVPLCSTSEQYRKTTEENVYLFVPNLIGYARIVLAALALYYMPFHPRYCTLLYGASTLLDAADGYAARALKQASQFGAVLDMIVDRTLTTGSRHHKEIKEDVSRILRWYYKKPVLFTMCAGNELFFVALYLIKWDQTPLHALLPYAWTSSEFFVENVPRFVLRLTCAQALAAITLPISLGKNIVNVVQAWKASKVLVGVDLRERALAKAKAT